MKYLQGFAVAVFAFFIVQMSVSEKPEQNIVEAKHGIVIVFNKSITTPEPVDGVVGAPKEENGLGTGYIVDENYIITNYHVARDSVELSVVIEGQTQEPYKAEMVFGDPVSDIAVVKLVDWKKFKEEQPQSKILKFADELPVDAQSVWTIGHPWGLFYSISHGIVSNDRRIPPNTPIAWFIQTDAKVYQGNSGGPMLDDEGDIIGMNSEMISNTGGSYGLALPNKLIQKVLNDFEKYGEARWAVLGVGSKNSDSTITEVGPGSAAQKAGLLVGDRILTMTVGMKSTEIKTISDLKIALSMVDSSDVITLIVMRNDIPVKIDITPDFKKASDFPH